ncbi:hypothetical protein ACNOYE_09960 [Nannocystaceae bacterium ST9]
MSTPEDDEALRLNGLHRFRKHSPRLLLQEYSHCEVPAGCGGVVLRWIDREAGLPALVRLAALGPIDCWLDDVELRTTRIELSAGPHVLALAIRELPGPGTPMLAELAVNLPDQSETLVRSEASRWWIVDAPPAGDWTRPGYDAAAQGWRRASEHSDYAAALGEHERWRWSSIARNARALALPDTQAWLRCEFTLTPDLITRHLTAAEERWRDR